MYDKHAAKSFEQNIKYALWHTDLVPRSNYLDQKKFVIIDLYWLQLTAMAWLILFSKDYGPLKLPDKKFTPISDFFGRLLHLKGIGIVIIPTILFVQKKKIMHSAPEPIQRTHLVQYLSLICSLARLFQKYHTAGTLKPQVIKNLNFL